MYYQRTCPNCNSPVPDDMAICTTCGTEVGDDVVERVEYKNKIQYIIDTSPYSMTWYKFLGFGFLLSALGNGFAGARYFSGSAYLQYGITGEEIYSLFPAVQSIDNLMGCISLVFVVICIITSIKLKRLERKAPKWVYSIYILTIVCNVAYSFLISIAVGDGDFTTAIGESIAIILVYGVLLLCNYKYFEKRKSLFKFDEDGKIVEEDYSDNYGAQTIKPKIMYCRKCGSKLPKDKWMCEACGTEVEEV